MDKNWGKKKKLSNTNELENVLRDESLEPQQLRSAEERIQSLVILNAWRNERENNKGLQAEVVTLKSQVDSLQLQVYTLRQLLDAENARVVNFNSDIKKLLTALDEFKNDKNELIKEKELLEGRLHALEENLVGMENDCNNHKNELMTARSEAQHWEKQLEREREKLLRMKDERKFFIDENIPENGEESKESTNSVNSRKTSKESRVKGTSCKSGKKNGGRGREDRGAGKVDFGKNVGCIKKLLKESLSVFDEPD